MNLDEIYAELDKIYENEHWEGVEEFLLGKITEALEKMDTNALVSLINELIGYYREHSEYEKCIAYCVRLVNIVEQSELSGTMAEATTFLNVATCYRSAGLLKESSAMYQKVKSFYDANLAPESMLYASLFNNMSLLFQEMGDFESACDCLERALGISLLYPECEIEQATTYANLANTLIQLGRIDEAKDNLNKSIELFEKDSNPDYHYSAALSALAEIYYREGNYKDAVRYYEKSLKHIERKVGKSKAYEITLANLNAAKSQINTISGLSLSKKYYEEYGRKMIEEKFSDYAQRIAVGLVGEGSECFGYDDDISMDHDFGPGFCMWLTDEDYELFGDALEKEYLKLPDEYEGIKRIDSGKAGKRTGVFRISDFYKNKLGYGHAPSDEAEWLYVDESNFAVVANGQIYTDELGEFSKIRNDILSYYPESVYVKRVARCAALISQYGQYNYKRMLNRNDTVAAGVALYRFTEEVMNMIYLLNKKYAPFYKWMHKGLESVSVLSKAVSDLEFISALSISDNRIDSIIEEICSDILAQLVKDGLAIDGDNYLDNHTGEIMDSTISKEELVEHVVELEWKAFDKVKNEGGRAYCQDDYETFSIMRRSQYLLWNKAMLRSFIDDFETANRSGWNIITEKYGRMEESTAPSEYEKIKEYLPEVSEEKKAIVEAIVSIQVGMMEEFAVNYPKSACQARSIHTSEDSLFNTSYETYLRGELLTYADKTLKLYGEFVVGIAKEGGNIARMTMENTARMYGYSSIDELESKLS